MIEEWRRRGGGAPVTSSKAVAARQLGHDFLGLCMRAVSE